MTKLKSSEIKCVAEEHCAKNFTIEHDGKSYDVLAFDAESAEQAVTDWLKDRADGEPHPELFE